jgi:hypothetical protein
MKPDEIITEPVQIAFPALFEPKSRYKDSPRLTFQATLILPPSYDLAPLRKCMQAAAAEKWGAKLPSKERMAAWGNPLRKCEEKGDDNGELPKGFLPGGHFIAVHSDYQPPVVDQATRPVKDKNMVYPGMFCRFHLNAFAWENGGRWGISFGLNGVQLVRDGERLDGRRPATDLFQPIEGIEPATTGGAPVDEAGLFG